MASLFLPAIDFLSIPKGPFVFLFQLMDDHTFLLRTVLRLTKNCLTKAYSIWTFGSIQNNFEQDSEEIHPQRVRSVCNRHTLLISWKLRSTTNYFYLKRSFLWTSYCEQNCLCVEREELEGALQITKTNNQRPKLVEVCFLKKYFYWATFP